MSTAIGNDLERPPLPIAKQNPHLDGVESEVLVKFQVIKKGDNALIVGRVKVNHPGGHAYVLRRYDTGYISLTTMWKAAFPGATGAAERAEIAWFKEAHNIPNSPEELRLAGLWLPLALAHEAATEYKLIRVVQALSAAVPDEQAVSQRDSFLASVQPAETTPVPLSKRRKSSLAPASKADAAPASPGTPKVRRTRSSTKSPAPSSKAGRPSKGRKTAEPIVEDTEPNEDEVPTVTAEEDIAEQKALVEKLKSQMNGAPTSRRVSKPPSSRRGVGKRSRGEENELANGKEVFTMNLDNAPEDKSVARPIITNSRIGSLVKWPSLPSYSEMEPRSKSVAWGTLAFAVAAGATTLLPQFF